ncbi:MAG: bifunctional folylpolyglutamate synthase/dihydrofolate synthase [Candidatus Latescibacteria bacterium]|nr:bifunctional folylpolyglutamate synthase/dihydrofolate synthase [Candidatus Latescibacterota bacterium]
MKTKPEPTLTSYKEAAAFIFKLTNYEKTADYKYDNAFKLDRVFSLLDHVDNPHQRLEAIHIAGTKGKGSTAAMIASILSAGGFRVGLYTSPHLVSFRERIRVDGHAIPKTDFAALLNQLRPFITPPTETQRCSHSFFDVLTVMAFMHFARQEVDVAILEVGMGGRIDATNVIHPRVCVITPISFDHTRHLGTDLTAIAAEKAGIIKPDCPTVTAPQPSEAMEVIRRVAREQNAPLIEVGTDVLWREKEKERERERGRRGAGFEVVGMQETYRDLWVPLLGDHQRINAATAIAALEALGKTGRALSETTIRAGLAGTRALGRISVIGERPTVVLDVAHNPASFRELRETLKKSFDFKRLLLVFALHKDKDADGIIHELAPIVDYVFLPAIDSPRIRPKEELRGVFERHDIPCTETHTVAEAISSAGRAADPDDLICIAGSFMLAEQAIEHFGMEVA